MQTEYQMGHPMGTAFREGWCPTIPSKYLSVDKAAGPLLYDASDDS